MCTKNCCFCFLIFACFILLINFYFFCAFCVANIFLKKIELVFIASFTKLLMCTPPNSHLENLFFSAIFYQFFTNFFTKLLSIFTIFYQFFHQIYQQIYYQIYHQFFHKFFWSTFSSNLPPIFLPHSLIFIYVHLFLSVSISSYLWKSFLIDENLLELSLTFMRISKSMNTIVQNKSFIIKTRQLYFIDLIGSGFMFFTLNSSHFASHYFFIK